MVARLLWEQDVGSSSLPSRTKIPLKSLISEGFCLFLVYCGAGFECYCRFPLIFPQRFNPSSSPQLLQMPVVQLAHTLVCFSLNLAKLSDSQASCNECCFKLTEKVSSPIPKEQGNAMHLELIYIENLAASQNSMDSIATPGANLYIAGD